MTFSFTSWLLFVFLCLHLFHLFDDLPVLDLQGHEDGRSRCAERLEGRKGEKEPASKA